MTKVEDSGREMIGNTNSIISPAKKDIGKLKKWFFTFNNYEKEDIDILNDKFKSMCTKYCFQEETGSNGTKHLQGNIWLKKAMRYTEFKLSKKIHWEGTKDDQAAWDYCTKEETRTGNRFIYPVPKKVCRTIEKLRPWQQQILDECIGTIPDKRKINWVYDEKGCNGKTELLKYMAVNHTDKIITATAGGAKDIANLIKNRRETGMDLNDDISFMFNITKSNNRICYEMMENVKDGMITNIKYECVTEVFNNPHVWVMSNDLPEFEKLTADKWVIWVIDDNKLKNVTSDYI